MAVRCSDLTSLVGLRSRKKEYTQCCRATKRRLHTRPVNICVQEKQLQKQTCAFLHLGLEGRSNTHVDRSALSQRIEDGTYEVRHHRTTVVQQHNDIHNALKEESRTQHPYVHLYYINQTVEHMTCLCAQYLQLCWIEIYIQECVMPCHKISQYVYITYFSLFNVNFFFF